MGLKKPTIERITAMALRVSAAEYACLVRRSHSSNAQNKVDVAINGAVHYHRWCLRPTKIHNLYLINGITPPDDISR